MRRVAGSLPRAALVCWALLQALPARSDEPDSALVAPADSVRATAPDSVRAAGVDSTRIATAPDSARRAGALDSLGAAAADSARRVRPDSATARHGMRDTVTVLPQVRVEGPRAAAPTRSTATMVRLERSRLTRFLPSRTGDALLSVPGLELVKTGPWASSISLRGLAGDRVLLMVDGVRLNGVRGHGAQTSLLALDDLEEVEVMSGSNSTLYGSDALGGAIDFVTQRNLFADRLTGSAVASARAAAPGDDYAETLRAHLGGAHFGFEAAGRLGNLRALTTPQGEIPRSGDREASGMARGAARWGSFVLDYSHRYTAAHDVGLPAFASSAGSSGVYPLQSLDIDRLELSYGGSSLLKNARLLAVNLGNRSGFTETTVDSVFVRGHFVATRTSVAADRVHTRARSLEPVVELQGPGHLRLLAGLREEKADGPRQTDFTVRDNSGAVTGHSIGRGESVPRARRDSWAIGAMASETLLTLRVEAGARYDALRSRTDSTVLSTVSPQDVSDHRTSVEGGLSRALGPLEPYVHVATSFRDPNLDERYFDDYIHGGLRLIGNPGLRPERSVTYEAGVRAAEDRLDWVRSARISAYRSDVEDLISFHYVGALYLIPRFQYANVQRARIEGIETMIDLRLGPVGAALSVDLPRGVDRETGQRLSDGGAPRGVLDLTVPVPRLWPQGTLAARLRVNGAVRDVDTTLARPGFSTVELEASSVIGGVRAVLAIRNLANASYREPLSLIPEPGRTVALSLRRSFDFPLGGSGAR